MDTLKNFATTTIASVTGGGYGTSITVATGTGTTFPTVPFNATVWPSGQQPTTSNAEIVRVTNVTGDVLTVTRGQEGTSAMALYGGMNIAQTVTAGLLNQLAPLSGATFTGAVSGTTISLSGNDSAATFAASGIGTATTSTRYVGGTNNGPPTGTSQAFSVGDWVVDLTATIWVCTTAGSPGVWWPTVSSDIVLRSSGGTSGAPVVVTGNETTVWNGSTTGQYLAAPSNPVSGATWRVISRGTATVTLNFTPSMYPFGSSSTATSFLLPVNGVYTFVNYGGSNWYMTSANDLSLSINSVPVAQGGTGATSVGSNGQVAVSNGTAMTYTDNLSNKRITKRVVTQTGNTTPYTINTDVTDVYHVTGQSTTPVNFANPSGTPVDGDTLRISMTGTTTIGLTWGTTFESSGNVLLPAATAGTTRLDMGFVYNAETSKWRIVAVA